MNKILISANAAIDSIFQQMGFNYEKIKTIHADKEFELLFLLDKEINITKNELKKLLRKKRNIAIDIALYQRVFKKNIKFKQINYLISESDSIFSEIGLIDLFTKIGGVKLKSFYDKNLSIGYNTINNGKLIVLPFEFEKLLTNTDSTRKKFYFKRKELPSEEVAKLEKGKIRLICENLIKNSFDENNSMLISKNYHPETYESTFIFRIDTDFCKIEDAEKLLHLIEKYEIKSTWFLDTENEKNIKDFYKNISGQEIGLHCYKHKIFKKYKDNYDNIKKGKKILHKYGIKPVGFAAPFGEWNSALQKALEALNFAYSSDFGYDYDNFPAFPVIEEKKSSVLQIPIHPISPGRLRRSHFSIHEMITYYKQVIDKKLLLNEPVILYHHPHHQMFKVIEEIFKYIRSKPNIWFTTMHNFNKWWRKRDEAEFDYKLGKDRISINKFNFPENLNLRAAFRGKTTQIMNDDVKLNSLDFKSDKQYHPPRDIERIRSFSWRDLLYNYEKWKGKRKL
mgnify:CR=1 FL=1